MKNNLLTFLLGGFVFVSLAASTTNLITIKPAMPKSVISVECRSESAVNIISKYTAKGYVFKSFTAGAYYDYDGLLVMEKY